MERDMTEGITPYPDINKVLDRLSDGLTQILGDQLVGLYLTGSLTYGDFDYGSSDIDFLAVLDKVLSETQLEEVKAMHDRIGESVPRWAKRLEGSYITEEMLGRSDRPTEPRTYVNAGKMNHLRYGNEWIINLSALHERSVALTGPDPKDIFPKVTMEQVREASKRDLIDEWLPKLGDPDAFHKANYDSEHLKAYAVLTMCRILYRNENDGVVSKRVASAWVKKTYGSKWSDLVEKAEHWQHGQDMDSDETVKDFIRFTSRELEHV